MLKYALLGFLNYSPMTGYDLKHFMDTSTTHFWNAKQSQVYITLKALQEEGLIQSVVEEQQSRPDRRVYSITDAGRTALTAWLNEPLAETETVKSSLLLKLFFSARLDKETLIAQLRVQHGLHRRQAEVYKAETRATIEAITAQNPEMKRDAVMWEATRRFGEIHEELYIQWLEETIATLEKEL
jgi:PadR family transcriptional regulator AphA